MLAKSAPRSSPRNVGVDGEDIDVLVVDDHPGVRFAIEGVARLQPAVVIMDLGMPGMNGVEATREICKRKAAPVVVVFSASRELWREAVRARDSSFSRLFARFALTGLLVALFIADDAGAVVEGPTYAVPASVG